ncbi:ABC-ATPase domain-containing protein [Brevibacterium jeotgali]|uniref:Predicted ATPase of the ABC class n=1 Tax=Brevibacterium jeotgali TaxID=1262550 RepID=A0A2H1L2P9_9MICO|nr:ABC-ATPase domain-containing protein [Brevibacterium jeotgali]TWC03086.1 putative ABC-class ATPase [Brevibacterium jeotgali]SMY11109.1 Predicted ATPase of the ABC class [Brevibacterium jeotgali]
MDLAQLLTSLDGRGYGDYKRIRGTHALLLPGSSGHAALDVDRVQVDPFAPPSLTRVRLDRVQTGIPDDLLADRAGRIAAGDFLTRAFARAASARLGGGSSSPRRADRDTPPPILIGTPGQQVLERTSVVFTDAEVDMRITVALPAAGRRIKGRRAASLLCEELPQIVLDALVAPLDLDALRAHVTLYRDQLDLRAQLKSRRLVSFVADGALLPRRSGDSDLPLTDGGVPFRSPDVLKTSFDLPSGRRVSGMGVPEGITVIIGGGYHGKSTLLRAIERGVYPHISGDGREWVLSRPDAVAIRAEDGRSTASVDISPFINDLPSGADTRTFTTTNASGSTSQAANLIEAVEAGASALLIDEDTSATNFMIRDDRMRRLIPAHREPITPFVDRVRALHDERGVSTVLVAGGSGAFFDVADHVIALDAYVPDDVTEQARTIARENDASVREDGASAGCEDPPDQSHPRLHFAVASRVPEAGSLRPADKRKFARARGRATIQYGRDDIDLSAVLQLVDTAQTQAIAHALERLADSIDAQTTLTDAVAALDRLIDDGGLDALSPHPGHPGHLARPRPQEVAAAVNRYRGLRIRG